MMPERAEFGRLPSGVPVEVVTLRGAGGFAARVLTFGATLQALLVPGRDGLSDVVAGHDTLDGYLAGRNFFGATIGRYANRISGGRFGLDGAAITLPTNNGPHTLHGGPEGFDRQLWEVAEVAAAPEPRLVLRRLSPAGEGGFPGALDTRVSFAVTGDAELSVRFEARSTAPTVVNLTNHSFFHLGGGGGDVLAHRLRIAASRYLPTDATLIPLGAPAPVDGTPFDFRQAHPIGGRIREADEQLLRAQGYDHNFCLDGWDGTLREAARLEDPASGRAMTLLTDRPGLQFYSGNFLDGSVAGKGGRPLRQSDALCLEPQDWPDAPNRPDYPSTRLDPGDTYRHSIAYRFSRLPT
ncbi:aldose epimerase family protein [Roseomonas elaeocarpi]|uniref:Aldose 1-epimerase n=1 Tax=Roseomonas elaeocarpi TaxID=907779 RepID=A0ABV6JZ60_9PROT